MNQVRESSERIKKRNGSIRKKCKDATTMGKKMFPIATNTIGTFIRKEFIRYLKQTQNYYVNSSR